VADEVTGEAHARLAAIPGRIHTFTPTVTMARITTPIRTLGCITVAGAEVITAGAVSVAEPARRGLNENGEWQACSLAIRFESPSSVCGHGINTSSGR
jgi:hypothetical protein